jgi:hypothetical protein
MLIGYALAADHPDRVARVALGEAPLPGITPANPLVLPDQLVDRLWHIPFNQLKETNEKLVRGREDIFFGAEFSAAAGTKKAGSRSSAIAITHCESDGFELRSDGALTPAEVVPMHRPHASEPRGASDGRPLRAFAPLRRRRADPRGSGFRGTRLDAPGAPGSDDQPSGSRLLVSHRLGGVRLTRRRCAHNTYLARIGALSVVHPLPLLPRAGQRRSVHIRVSSRLVGERRSAMTA